MVRPTTISADAWSNSDAGRSLALFRYLYIALLITYILSLIVRPLTAIPEVLYFLPFLNNTVLLVLLVVPTFLLGRAVLREERVLKNFRQFLPPLAYLILFLVWTTIPAGFDWSDIERTHSGITLNMKNPVLLFLLLTPALLFDYLKIKLFPKAAIY